MIVKWWTFLIFEVLILIPLITLVIVIEKGDKKNRK